MIYHSVELNVQKNTSNCSVELYEKDKNSHQLLIKLVTDQGYFNVSDYRPEIEFYDSVKGTKVLTTAVDIVNSARGYLSYVLGERIVQNPSRYTVSLRLIKNPQDSEQISSEFTCTFILNVLKDYSRLGCDCFKDVEVTISKEFYEELTHHLDNSSVHVSESDRVILKYLSDNLDSLATKEDIDNLSKAIESLSERVKVLEDKINSANQSI